MERSILIKERFPTGLWRGAKEKRMTSGAKGLSLRMAVSKTDACFRPCRILMWLVC